jgi:hypothetical protein
MIKYSEIAPNDQLRMVESGDRVTVVRCNGVSGCTVRHNVTGEPITFQGEEGAARLERAEQGA